LDEVLVGVVMEVVLVLLYVKLRFNEKEMLAPSYLPKVAAVSHGRASWQID
jgi:hypothetical protein